MPSAKAPHEQLLPSDAASAADAPPLAHSNLSWCQPDWPAPANIGAGFSTRHGGYSQGSFAGLNVGDHVGDDSSHVAANRQLIADWIAADVAAHQVHADSALYCKSSDHHIAAPQYLQQVHGTVCVELPATLVRADAAVSGAIATPCVVMTADCLPVLFCDQQGTMVAAAHAGWRGLCDGVLEQTVAQFDAKGVARSSLLVWLGPAIGPAAFEVGAEVRQAFMAQDASAALAFRQRETISDKTLDKTSDKTSNQSPEKWLADLYLLARQRLNAMGITAIYGGDLCTYTDAERFFSYRRDGQTGRMVTAIWRRR